MKRVLITGGTGTVGSSFIKEYYDKYSFYTYGTDEEQIHELNNLFPKVVSIIGDICYSSELYKAFDKIKPDIVIHCAALKHIDIIERNQTKAVEINCLGSLNVIDASIKSQVPLTIGISTDKACNPTNTYGYTKKLMEEMFFDSYNTKTKFICTRFANVACSNGSVIPYWKELINHRQKIKLTSPEMNRLMLSKQESAQLIQKAIELSNTENDSFILSKKMKSVNMLSLAKVMTDNEIDIIGLRIGERLNETLISKDELEKTKIIDGGYILLKKEKCDSQFNLKEEYSSLTAEKANDLEIMELIYQ